MPWRHTSPMDQKTQLIAASLRDRLSVTERCARDGVSRKTGVHMDRPRSHARPARPRRAIASAQHLAPPHA